jgi:hypothetical protein
MKKVLVLYFSQSGQLEKSVKSLTKPLSVCDEVAVDYRPIKPVRPYPYPWPFYTFFDAFPESVYMDGCEVEPVDAGDEYDLIILGYTSWFLSPSIPVTGFLKSPQAKRLFNGKPVVTVIACRDMWVMAQEKMKTLLKEAGGHLIDNVVLTDQGRSLYTFVTTPRWLFTGRKDAFWFFPPAGVLEEDIAAASRFGVRLCEALKHDEEKRGEPLLRHMGAVNVNGKLIATEKIATRSFMIWGKLIKKAGKPGSSGRRVVISLYAVFLVLLILTVVPLNMLVRKLLSPFTKKKLAKAVAYYEQPSGK